MSSFDEQYDVRTFTPALVDGVPDEATSSWLAATRIAFHQTNSTAAVMQSALGAIADGRAFTGVYSRTPLPGALDASWPVGTYTGYTKTINVGGGALVDSYLVSDVTVRPTHKRRGMLRHMMTARLAEAAESGLAIAALTASESTIYRRFGFGPAVRSRAIAIRKTRSFSLHGDPAGRVEMASAASLGAIARDVFARFHSTTPGSVDRQAQLWDMRLGLAGDDGKPDETLRAALHYATENPTTTDEIDGYVVYRMKEDGRDDVLEVVDLVGASANAVLGLWHFVGSVDLVDRITFRAAPVDDVLLHAIVDSRSLETTSETDHIWLRILDPVAALSARPYSADGVLTLGVRDKLGYSEGVFRLTVVDGRGTVDRVADAPLAGGAVAGGAVAGGAEPDLELDAATLASIYLGGTPVRVLAEAGQIVAHHDGAIEQATAMFAPDRPVYAITDF